VAGAHGVAGHEDVPRLRAAVAHERADRLQQRPAQRVVRPVEPAVDLAMVTGKRKASTSTFPDQ
jgi:hypothetical protein